MVLIARCYLDLYRSDFGITLVLFVFNYFSHWTPVYQNKCTLHRDLYQ